MDTPTGGDSLAASFASGLAGTAKESTAGPAHPPAANAMARRPQLTATPSGEALNDRIGIRAIRRFPLITLPLIAACVFSPISGADSEPTVVRLQPVRALTSDDDYSDGEPAVSPDGQRVVFTRIDAARRQRRRLWTVSIGGNDPRPLTPHDSPYDCSRASWSPDGNSLAFRAGRPERPGAPGAIWLMTLDGEMRPLTDETRFNDFYPQWSPDGKWLAITREVIGEGYDSIWIVGLDGTERRITSNTDDGKSTVSPDGKYIAFGASPRSSRGVRDRIRSNIRILSTKDGEKSARQFTLGGGRGPTWSRDGRWIAFTSNRPSVDYYGQGYALFLKSVYGGLVIQVTDGNANDFNPEWSPDGKSIVVAAVLTPGRSSIAVVNVLAIVR